MKPTGPAERLTDAFNLIEGQLGIDTSKNRPCSEEHLDLRDVEAMVKAIGDSSVKKQAHDDYLVPLLIQVRDICKRYDIPLLVHMELGYHTEHKACVKATLVQCQKTCGISANMAEAIALLTDADDEALEVYASGK